MFFELAGLESGSGIGCQVLWQLKFMRQAMNWSGFGTGAALTVKETSQRSRYHPAPCLCVSWPGVYRPQRCSSPGWSLHGNLEQGEDLPVSGQYEEVGSMLWKEVGCS